MLNLYPVDQEEIFSYCKTNCQMCSAEIFLAKASTTTDVEQLADQGWHSVELADEIYSAVCKECISELLQQEKRGEL